MDIKEKEDIIKRYHEIADHQANAVIDAIEKLDANLKGANKEQRDAAVHMLLSLSTNTLKASIDALAEQMQANIPKVKLEDLNVR